MRIVRISGVGRNYRFKWPEGSELFDYWVDYEVLSEDGEHVARIGFRERSAYGMKRARAVVWIDRYPYAEFLGADDFSKSGEVMSEVKFGAHMCRYPDEPVPQRYAMFNVAGLPTRIKARGVHTAWAVVSNIADHKSMIALASLRKFEKRK